MYKDKAGKYRFHLKASNGEIVAAGEAYESNKAPSEVSTRYSVPRPTPQSTTRPARNSHLSGAGVVSAPDSGALTT